MAVLFPHLNGLRIESVDSTGVRVRIEARTGDEPAACPGCGMLSRRVHSRYGRRLSDTAITGREVVIRLRVRRLFCVNSDCGRRTFAEQVTQLAARHARRTTILQRLLCAVALALGGRPGARMTGHLAATVSRMTLLRQIRALPDPDHATPRVLGVDDFALRRGHHYGTILIDIETRRPVDVLGDRTAATLAAWLRAHPGVEIVCRDRAGAYADGVATAAPDALQVADRWHVWHNLGEAVERAVARYRNCLDTMTDTEQASTDGQEIPVIPEVVAPPLIRTDKWAVRTRERYAAIHTLLADGVSMRSVGAQLGLARGTVRRFARAANVEELLVNTGTGQRRSLLEEFKPYLHQRWNEGCTNATELFHEIKARGYRGGPKIVMNYLHPFRTTGHIPRAARKPPSVRRVVSWLMSDPANLDSDDQHRLDAILTASPELTCLAGHIRAFATMMRQRRGRELEQWMKAVDADDLPALHSFVRGLRRDFDAVTAGLTLPWSSGPVEGHVNRIKMVKRQMFGRAKPDLLRKRILLSD
ncbi:ISL3 family transposase [Nocardia sp. NBC_01503]|uniref:ISL3 family transposase n=1 Tax=Nocardia sp. NBC_01503 TaxID=2975997 RepID=UPI002E7B4890|nr:ISL3 family transposase [Nocardia sp. NBC_01503]WTL32792.1 ISL3 family transposase [Nocardia sp. NBC_01503]